MYNYFFRVFFTIPVLFCTFTSPAQTGEYGKSALANQMGSRIVNSRVFTFNELNGLAELSINMEGNNEAYKSKRLQGRAATSSDRSIGSGYVCFDCGDGAEEHSFSCDVENTNALAIEHILRRVLSPNLNRKKYTVKYQKSYINYYAGNDVSLFNNRKKYRVLSKVGITNYMQNGIHFLMTSLPFQLQGRDVSTDFQHRHAKRWKNYLIDRTRRALTRRGLKGTCY